MKKVKKLYSFQAALPVFLLIEGILCGCGSARGGILGKVSTERQVTVPQPSAVLPSTPAPDATPISSPQPTPTPETPATPTPETPATPTPETPATPTPSPTPEMPSTPGTPPTPSTPATPPTPSTPATPPTTPTPATPPTPETPPTLETPSTPVPEMPLPPPTRKWKLAWADEFEGETLDLSRWQHRIPGVRRGGFNTPEAVTVKNGNLVITTTYNPIAKQYETGMIGTQPTFQQRYGYFEARIKLLTKEGHWQAFWLQSPKIGNTVNPPNPTENGAEVDIMEYKVVQKGMVFFSVHWNGYGPGYQKNSFARSLPTVAPGTWHTFGVLWTPTGYTFYVDSKPAHTISVGVSQIPQYIILSNEVTDTATFSWAGQPKPEFFPDTMEVDYVRVYETTDGQYPAELIPPQ